MTDANDKNYVISLSASRKYLFLLADDEGEETSPDSSWPNEPADEGMKINVVEIMRGQLIAEIRPPPQFSKATMKGVSYIYYDERHHELYTGHADGTIHLWY